MTVVMPSSQQKLTAYIVFFASYISIAAAISSFDLGIYLPLINVYMGYGGTALQMVPSMRCLEGWVLLLR